MGWTDLCSWTSCLGARKDEPEDTMPPRPISNSEYHEEKQEASEKKFSAQEKVLQPPPPPPSVVSDRPYSHNITERDLPPVPPVPVTSIYEMGFSSPRSGVTRSNSRSSVKTSTSVKSRKRRTQNLEKHTTSPTGLRRVDRTQSIDQQAAELASPPTSHRSSVRQPFIPGSGESDGKASPFPGVSRSSPTRTKIDDELPIACEDEEEEAEEDEYDDDSLKEMRRRSDSAPIPVRAGLRHSHTIRRKPVTPKASISFSRPATVQSTVLESYAEQLRASEGPIEMDAPITFELSADPKSRTQSYYADPGIVLLAATLDEVPPPLPEQPSLLVNTGILQKYATTDSPSKKLPFSPLTTVSSPVDDMAVSPITPHARKSRDRMTWMKRSKSVGAASASKLPADLKRRSLHQEPPLPILPASTYSPSIPNRQSHPDSLLKTESTNDSSRRTSNSSDQSETSSQSSMPSRGPSPSNTNSPTIIKRTKKPEQELEMLKPIAFQRRSTNAPIPLISSNDGIPLVPSLPPQAYHFKTPIPERRSSAGLVRSLSSKNLRNQGSESPSKSPKFGRSKSIYCTATSWNNSSIPSLPKRSHNKELPALPQHPTAIPLPDSDTETDSDNESEYGSVKSGAAELESQDQTGQYIEETEPRSVLPTPIERENPLQEPWGKGMGAEWGVAY